MVIDNNRKNGGNRDNSDNREEDMSGKSNIAKIIDAISEKI